MSRMNSFGHRWTKKCDFIFKNTDNDDDEGDVTYMSKCHICECSDPTIHRISDTSIIQHQVLITSLPSRSRNVPCMYGKLL